MQPDSPIKPHFDATVDRAARESAFRRERANVDDVRVTCTDHARSYRPAGQKDRPEIRIQNRIPIGLAALIKRAENADAGVIHQNFDLPKFIVGSLNHFADIFCAGDVCNQRQNSYALILEICGSFFDFIAAPGTNRDGGTQMAEARGDSPTNAAAWPQSPRQLFPRAPTL
jgi:hypothetical protein